MVSWGLICIATNYTHDTGVPLGSRTPRRRAFPLRVDDRVKLECVSIPVSSVFIRRVTIPLASSR